MNIGYIDDRPDPDINIEKHNLTFAAEQSFSKQVTPKDVAASKLVDFDTNVDMQRTNVKSKAGEHVFLATSNHDGKSQDKS